MTKGNVLYKGRVFKILFCYDTGYCEIRDIYNVFKVELVHNSQLTMIEDVCTNQDIFLFLSWIMTIYFQNDCKRSSIA